MTDVVFTVNGCTTTVQRPPMTRLLDVLRQDLGLTGTKEGCGEGECGACTVLLEGQPVLSCLVPVIQCAERTVATIEHLTAAPGGRELAARLVTMGGVQCGACTPGVVVTAWALLQTTPAPTREQVQDALCGNLCRCTGYEGIIRALVADDSPGPGTST